MTQDTWNLISLVSWVGVLIFGCAALYTLDKHGREQAAKLIPVPVQPTTFAWVFCPNGHCKVLANREWSCPVCEARLS